jgi:anti-sigma B factor antagonist
MELQVGARTEGPVTIIDVTGEVDLYTAPRLEEALARGSAGTPPLIVVNLSKTTYMDSTALRVLTAALKRVREREGALTLVSTQPKIAKLFTITGLDQVFPICATEPEAIERARAYGSRQP